MKKLVATLINAYKAKKVLSMVKGFCRKNAPFLAMVGIAAVPSLASAAGTDLFSSQQDTVSATFGHGSSIEKWFYFGEVILGLFGYMKTRSPMVFGGIAMVMIFTRVAFAIIG